MLKTHDNTIKKWSIILFFTLFVTKVIRRVLKEKLYLKLMNKENTET